MNPRPRNGYVIVRVLQEDAVKSGIILPNGHGGNPLRGIVLYLDESHRLLDGAEMDLHAGDEVLFHKSQATELRLGEEDVLLLHEKHILAVTDAAPVYSSSQ